MSEEETIHESETKRSRRGIASILRRIAGALNRGKPVPVDEEGTVAIEVPEEAELEIELEREDDEVSLELELEWPEEEVSIDTEAVTSKARFERYEDQGGDWRWRLVHQNGNIIADGSEGYSSKQKATQGIESVRKNAPGAYVEDLARDEVDAEDGGSNATFEVYSDDADDWRWRLVHDNGEIIADGGQGYSSKQKAKQGLRSVKTNVFGAPIEDE